MKIIITENQLKTIILKEQEEKKCLPEKKEWNEVDYSVENIEKGDTTETKVRNFLGRR